MLLVRLLLFAWGLACRDEHDPDGLGPRSLRPSVLARVLGRRGL
jgi:hypothetical protein